MDRAKPDDQLTLLDVLIDGFRKNEILDGYHMRDLTLPNEAKAIGVFGSFEEATRWQGAPLRTFERARRRLAAWRNFDIRQLGRHLVVRVWSPWMRDWRYDVTTTDADDADSDELGQWLADDTRKTRH
jgi:hypothetical protein